MSAPFKLDPAGRASANRALFAMTQRRSERVVVPLNDSASDDDPLIPAFFCVHSLSGAGGSDFLELARRMDPAVRFYGVQAPPSRFKDPHFGGSVEAIATHYAEAVALAQAEGPLMLGGWSAGATVALEMARILRAQGREVALLVALDGAPENTRAELAPWDPRYLAEVVANLPRLQAEAGKGWLAGQMRQIAKSVTALVRRTVLRLKGQTQPGVHPVEVFGNLQRFPKAQQLFMMRLYDAIFDYHPAPYAGELVIYEATTTAPFHLPQVARKWRRLAAQAKIVRLDGAHLSLMRPPHVEALAADLLRRVLAIRQPLG